MRSFSPLLAALILAVDGVGAWFLALVSFVMSLSVAAVEGRTGDPNAHLAPLALAFFGFGIVAIVAAWCVVRGVRSGRVLGMPVAGAAAVAGAALIWSGITENPLNSGVVGLGVVVLLAQLGVARVLASWHLPSPVTRHPQSRGIGVE